MVAVTYAEVGLIGRLHIVEVLRRNPHCNQSILDCVVVPPSDAIIVSLIRRRRWWRKVTVTGT